MAMRYLAASFALLLSACGHPVDAGSATATGGVSKTASTTITNSVQSNNSSSITSSTNAGSTSSNISSSVNNNESSCSTELNGKRCEISCQAPELAQCSNNDRKNGPSCRCAR